MSRLHSVFAYLIHWLHVVDEHSVHSPFFFDFYTNVVRAETDPLITHEIEAVRLQLLKDNTEIDVTDLGAGSTYFQSSKRKLGDIARISLTPPEYCSFYYRILQFLKAKNVVELGTSLGMTTVYLALNRTAAVTTFEGSSTLAQVAITHFEYFNTKNIQLIEGNIDNTLPEFLQRPSKINFALIDANHRYESTMRYFNWLSRRMSDDGIMVLDDIHLSPQMERAWKELKQHELVYGSVDLFRCGLLFFNPALNKQHYVWSLQ